MRGRKPVRPLAEVADAAVGVFIAKGFRAAGISDVSAALGLSHGALYTYVDSKQALLYLALLREVQPRAVHELPLPVTAPATQDIVTLLESWTASQVGFSGLDPAVRPVAQLTAADFGDIIDGLYGFVERHRQLLQLIGRCAADLPELAQWYFVQRRRATLEQLGEYLRRRIADGEFRPVPDVPTAARFIVETIAWFAMHRHGDPDSAMLDDATCRRTVRHLLLNAFLAAPSYAVPPAAAGQTG
jgi:AcrR family transcriptional regulator